MKERKQMTRTFIQTKEFSSRWDQMGFDDDDLRRLEYEIMINGNKYPVIQGSGGLRKLRISYQNHGKRGGARVCFVDFFKKNIVYLITVYSKNEKDNLTKTERNQIKKMIEILEKSI